MRVILDMPFLEIFKKLEFGQYVIVHMKDTMEPKILETDSGNLFDMPEGYLDYDKKRFYRKIV
jgi:hypothetical protein